VHLDVRSRRRHVDRRPGQPERRERLGRRDAGGVALGEVTGADVVHHTAAAEAPVAEPPPLLVAEDDDGERGLGPVGGHGRHRLERGDDAQRSVEATAGWDRVEVGAGPDLGARDGAARPCVEVAGGVARDGHPGLLAPAGHEGVGVVLGGAQPGAGDAAVVGHGADPSEEVEPLHRPLRTRDAGGRRHGGSSIDSAIIMVVMD
jgi:hypothetical protein